MGKNRKTVKRDLKLKKQFSNKNRGQRNMPQNNSPLNKSGANNHNFTSFMLSTRQDYTYLNVNIPFRRGILPVLVQLFANRRMEVTLHQKLFRALFTIVIYLGFWIISKICKQSIFRLSDVRQLLRKLPIGHPCRRVRCKDSLMRPGTLSEHLLRI